MAILNGKNSRVSPLFYLAVLTIFAGRGVHPCFPAHLTSRPGIRDTRDADYVLLQLTTASLPHPLNITFLKSTFPPRAHHSLSGSKALLHLYNVMIFLIDMCSTFPCTSPWVVF